MKAEEILKKHEEKNSMYFHQRVFVLEAMEEYGEICSDATYELFNAPLSALNKLEDAYRKEHPKDYFYRPDLTKLIEWVIEKINK